jgi:hypothetical protein
MGKCDCDNGQTNLQNAKAKELPKRKENKTATGNRGTDEGRKVKLTLCLTN